MNLQGKITLAFLEEDKPQSGLFRLRPLMNQEDAFTTDPMKEYPDDGYLRVVPDKNEQHTFKNRMRDIMPLCVIDLEKEAKGKIRKNRNYRPEKQENNQYVVYSNAVKPYPEEEYFQVVPQDGIQDAITKKVYIRSGANIQGPYLKTGEAAEKAVQKLPPDSHNLKTAELPDGRNVLLYRASAATPDTVSQERSQDNAKDMIQALNDNLAITANPLKGSVKENMNDLPAVPVGKGTQLIPVQIPLQARKKVVNPLAQAVEAQRNPAQSKEEKIVAAGKNTNGDAVFRKRLQEMEAERLSLVMELDRARRDLAAFTDQAIQNAAEVKKQELKALDKLVEDKKRLLANLTEQQTELVLGTDDPSKAAAKAGIAGCPDENTLIRQTMDAFHASGFSMNKMEAAGLLAVVAQSRGLFSVVPSVSSDTGIFCDALSDAMNACEPCFDALPNTQRRGGDAIRFFCVLKESPLLLPDVINIRPSPDWQPGQELESMYRARPWMFIRLPKVQGIIKASLNSEEMAAPSLTWLKHCFGSRALRLDAQDRLRTYADLFPSAILRLCAGFISAVCPHAEGSLSDVIDLALETCAVPYIKIVRPDKDTCLSALVDMPRTMKAFEK